MRKTSQVGTLHKSTLDYFWYACLCFRFFIRSTVKQQWFYWFVIILVMIFSIYEITMLDITTQCVFRSSWIRHVSQLNTIINQNGSLTFCVSGTFTFLPLYSNGWGVVEDTTFSKAITEPILNQTRIVLKIFLELCKYHLLLVMYFVLDDRLQSIPNLILMTFQK